MTKPWTGQTVIVEMTGTGSTATYKTWTFGQASQDASPAAKAASATTVSLTDLLSVESRIGYDLNGDGKAGDPITQIVKQGVVPVSPNGAASGTPGYLYGVENAETYYLPLQIQQKSELTVNNSSPTSLAQTVSTFIQSTASLINNASTVMTGNDMPFIQQSIYILPNPI